MTNTSSPTPPSPSVSAVAAATSSTSSTTPSSSSSLLHINVSTLPSSSSNTTSSKVKILKSPTANNPLVPPRKRSKVSRACDECRRKKIRCDANPDDEGIIQCSSCKRTGEKCSFCRIPMKRGPSKGQRRESSASNVSTGSPTAEKTSSSSTTGGSSTPATTTAPTTAPLKATTAPVSSFTPTSTDPTPYPTSTATPTTTTANAPSPASSSGSPGSDAVSFQSPQSFNQPPPPPPQPPQLFRKRAFSSSGSSSIYPSHSNFLLQPPAIFQNQPNQTQNQSQNQSQNQNSNENQSQNQSQPTYRPLNFHSAVTSAQPSIHQSQHPQHFPPQYGPNAPNSLPPPSPHRLPSIDFLTQTSSASPAPSASTQAPPTHSTWPPQYSSLANNPYPAASPYPSSSYYPNSLQLPDIHAANSGFSFSGPGFFINSANTTTGPHDSNPNRSGYTSRSNSVPSYLPSDAPEKLCGPAMMATASISNTLKRSRPSNIDDNDSDDANDADYDDQYNNQNSNDDNTNENKINNPNNEDAIVAHRYPMGTSLKSPKIPKQSDSHFNKNWQDRQIDSYYQIIHPTLPILPSSKIKLRAFLAACPNPDLQAALLSGLNGLAIKMASPGLSSSVTTNKSELLHAISQISESCGGLISDELPRGSRSLYLVCLIFMYLYTDESMWLSSAISIAYSMNLHSDSAPTSPNPTINSRSEEDSWSASRRLFLVLVILDSMTGAVKNIPPFIPESMIQFDEDRDAMCFGSRSGVEILKLCMVLRHVCRVKHQPSLHIIPSLYAELDSVKTEIEGIWDTIPILKALYHSVLVTICSLQFSPQSTVADHNLIYSACVKMISNLSDLNTLMVSPLISVSPLMGYFYQLVCDGACKILSVLPTSGVQFSNVTSESPATPIAHSVADIVALHDQTMKLLVYLQASGSSGSFFFGHPVLLKRMERILQARGQSRDEDAVSPRHHPYQQQQHHLQHHHQQQQPQQQQQQQQQQQSPLPPSPPTELANTCKYEVTSATRLLQSLRGSPPTIMMATSHSALEKLANAAEKVNLFI